MKILVSGGAGFIGSHLCDKLVSNGDEVICVDNFITGSEANVSHLAGNSRFILINHDITEPNELLMEKSGGRFAELDVIYNLASPASPVDYREMPLQTAWVNAAGTKNMLDLAVKAGAKFVQASTSEVYGDPAVHPQKESYFGNCNSVGERSCYNESKRFAESLCVNYHKQFGVPVKIARIFNTYGPRMRKDDGRVVSEFIVRALRGEPLLVHGDGNQTRSFCFIDDLVVGLLSLLSTGDEFTGPLNLGNPEEVSINRLAESVIELTGSVSQINHGDLSADDPIRRCPDIGLAKSAFGFAPIVSLSEGLKKTIAHYKTI